LAVCAIVARSQDSIVWLDDQRDYYALFRLQTPFIGLRGWCVIVYLVLARFTL
jgi:hypothetical protein